jgi:hypothetical protein
MGLSLPFIAVLMQIGHTPVVVDELPDRLLSPDGRSGSGVGARMRYSVAGALPAMLMASAYFTDLY